MNLSRALQVFGCLLMSPLGPICAEVRETRQLISEWVGTERLISEEKASWDKDRVLLVDLIATLKVENAALDENLAKSEAEMADVSRQRALLSEGQLRAKDAVKALGERIEALERQAQALVPAFPSPLRDRVALFVEAVQDPQRNNKFSLRERLENVVAVLQAANLFHQSVNLEKQKFTIGGKTREFQVLYYGFSVCYFVNSASTNAGYGIPGANGWEWTQDNALAKKVRKAVEIHNKRAMASFVELPVPGKPVPDKE